MLRVVRFSVSTSSQIDREMFRQIVLFALFSFVISFDEKLIYQCNFDQSTPTDHCFHEDIGILSTWFNVDENPPEAPLSDVTAITEPTNDTSICDLPFQWQNKTWNSFFCVRKICRTKRNNFALCQTGKFGLTQIFTTTTHRFTLKMNNSIESNENDEFSLTFFYFMSIDGEKSIEIRKKEFDRDEEILSTIRSSPFNGWIEHQINFSINHFPFQIFFDLQKSTLDSPSPIFAFDQLSIIQIHRPQTTTTEAEFVQSSSSLDSSMGITSTAQITTETEFDQFSSSLDSSTSITSTIATTQISSTTTTTAESSTQTNDRTSEFTSTTKIDSTSSLTTNRPTTTTRFETTREETSSSSLLTTKIIDSTTRRISSISTTSMKTSTNENATEKPNENNQLLIILLSVFIPLGLIIGISLITFHRLRLRRASKKKIRRDLYELKQTSSF